MYGDFLNLLDMYSMVEYRSFSCERKWITKNTVYQCILESTVNPIGHKLLYNKIDY